MITDSMIRVLAIALLVRAGLDLESPGREFALGVALLLAGAHALHCAVEKALGSDR